MCSWNIFEHYPGILFEFCLQAHINLFFSSFTLWIATYFFAQCAKVYIHFACISTHWFPIHTKFIYFQLFQQKKEHTHTYKKCRTIKFVFSFCSFVGFFPISHFKFVWIYTTIFLYITVLYWCVCIYSQFYSSFTYQRKKTVGKPAISKLLSQESRYIDESHLIGYFTQKFNIGKINIYTERLCKECEEWWKKFERTSHIVSERVSDWVRDAVFNLYM